MTADLGAIAYTVEADAGASTCGIHVSASRGSRSVDYVHSGSLQVAQATDGQTFNWMCGLKPVIAMALYSSIEQSRQADVLEHILSHKYSSSSSVSALDFLNLSDDDRWLAVDRIYREVLVASKEPGFHEVSMLARAEALAPRRICEAVDSLAGQLDLKQTFTRRPVVEPNDVGCLVEFNSEGRSIPLLHDKTQEFLDSPWLGYVGGYSSVSDMRAFYEAVLMALHGRGPARLPDASDLAALDNSDPGKAFHLGFMVNLGNWDIQVSQGPSFGHIGFLRTSIAYAEPDTGFVFAGIRRAVEFNNYESIPVFWSKLIGATRDLLV